MFGDILGFAGDLIGGIFGSNSQADANAANRDINAQNVQLQKDFAQQGLRWRAEDAKAAGLHPMAALGAQLPSFSPSSIHMEPVDGLSSRLGSMGQNVGRAIDATRTQPERSTARMEALSLDRAELENELLRSQIAQTRSQIGPALPSNSGMPALTAQGQGDAYVLEGPLSRVHSAPGRPHQEVGAVPDTGFVRTPSGLAPVPSKDAKERMEDMAVPELMWALRNNLIPTLTHGRRGKPSRSMLPSGADDWSWSTSLQEWYPVRRRSSREWFFGGR